MLNYCSLNLLTMSRILFLANDYSTLYQFRRELIKLLVERGDDVFLSLPNHKDMNYFTEQGCSFIPTKVDRRGFNPVSDLQLLRSYKKIIKDVSPDIIFSFTIKPNVYGSMANRKSGIRQVCNITGTGATFLKPGLLAFICKLLYKISIPKAYKVFFQNTKDRDFFVKNNMVGNNYEVIPGSGCNLETHPYLPLPQGEVINFIFIGRVMKLKGIDEYLDCAKEVKKRYSNANFLIAGWNEQEEYMKKVKEAEKAGYVKYLGYRKDIDTIIETCHCTVLCSHGGEGMPNVILESAAMGRICITTNTNGAEDAVDDGVTGYIYPKGEAAALIERVVKVINLSDEERAKMGKAGREKIEREFDRNIVITKYLKEIELAHEV